MPLILTNYDDDLPKLSQEELVREKNAFEWWYFDVETPDGASLVFVFKRKDPASILPLARGDQRMCSSIHIEYKNHGTTYNRLEDFAPQDFRCTPLPDDRGVTLSLGDHYVKIERNSENRVSGYEIHLALDDLTAHFHFVPLHEGFKPGQDGCYLVHKSMPNLVSHAALTAPLMQAKGSVTFDGITEEWEGHGYHDHPWGTQQLLNTHQEWHWGRLFSDRTSIVFAHVEPTKDFAGRFDFFYLAEKDQYVPAMNDVFEIQATDWSRDGIISFPRRLHITCADPGLTLTTQYERTLVNLVIYIRSRVKFTLQDERDGSTAEGVGWVEYFHVPPGAHRFLQLVTKLRLWTWRKPARR